MLASSLFSNSGSFASSRLSRARSAISVSDCELTETYSPAAMDIAPATSPAMPEQDVGLRRCGRSHTQNQARGRDDPVICAQHGSAKPSDPPDKMRLVVYAGHGSPPLGSVDIHR